MLARVRHVSAVVAVVALAGCGQVGVATEGATSHGSSRTAAHSRAGGGSGLPRVFEVAFARQITGVLASTLDLLSQRPRDGALHYYSRGVWHTVGFDCWRCDVAPGALAAELARQHPRDTRYRRLAIATFNAALRSHARADGSFGPALGIESDDQISTIVMANYLGIAYLELRSSLDEATRSRWLEGLERSANWLVPRLHFYVNGNDNLGETLTMYLAWRATHEQRFLRAYQSSLDFTMAPRGRSWRGFGLHYLRVPHRADGADGAAYLAEKETGGKPGFDPHYTIVQSGDAAALYALTRSKQALRLLNLLTGALLTRTNAATMLINTSNGSRRSAPSYGYLESPCLAVLALAGGRPSLARMLPPQLKEISVSFHNYATRATEQNEVITDYGVVLLAGNPPR
jgi:hypothetical protein